MAQVSEPIAVADATASSFDLANPTSKVAVAVVFYTTSDARTGEEVDAGSGTRDVAISLPSFSEDAGKLTMPVSGATTSALAARTWKTFDLAIEVSRISVACAAASNPGTATHYRIWVEV